MSRIVLFEHVSSPTVSMEDTLSQHVRGQRAAVAAVARSLKIGAAGLTAPTRPLSVLLLTGPTGVGKTAMVRAAASAIRGDLDDFCRVDMSSFGQEHYAAAFSGAPPGYAGSKEQHTVFERDRIEGDHFRPGIVLFDEVEKAHPVVLRALLHVLDSGVLRLSSGIASIDFRNCHVFMTSNLGSRSAVRYGRPRWRHWRWRSQVHAAVRRFFDPEFLNRIDEIVEFQPLSGDTAADILDIEIDRIARYLARRGVRTTVNDDVRRLLIDTGFDRDFGARSLHRTVRTTLLPPLAELSFGHASSDPCDVEVIVAPTGEVVCHRKDRADHPTEEECAPNPVRTQQSRL